MLSVTIDLRVQECLQRGRLQRRSEVRLYM
jgi:hypothetical protein